MKRNKADLLEGGGEEDVTFTINKDYASNYNTWRQKERLQKLKDRYGDVTDEESSSSSEEEDEDARELTKDIEKTFFKTLSCLKKKDPRIYDNSCVFFDDKKEEEEEEEEEKPTKKKEKKEKPFLLRDYERQVILEREGKFSDDEDNVIEKTPVEEQKEIKESFKKALNSSDSEEDSKGWGGLFQRREKTKDELNKEEEDYREWLKGQKEALPDKKAESDMKYLHDYWNDPKLDNDEAFLKDFILNRRFLDSDEEDYVPTYNEIVDESEDDATLKEQAEFERRFNFRFENGDQEFIKRYPRNVENSLRRKDDRRQRKRKEIKERKAAEKLAKEEEVKQLKALKRKEILEKIEKIKAVTGNAEMAFQDEDLEGDFNPDEHDERMKQLFNEEYYGEEEEEKPEFAQMDDELEVENWESWRGNQDSGYGENESSNMQQDYEYSEDVDFNMDCDYDPRGEAQDEIIAMTKSKKKRKRQSKLAQALARAKPLFDPNDKSFEQYIDEYYKLDFEDIVGGMPCRFKYRQTTPNSYGLTIDEILRADEKELNQWCSLKKIIKHKPDHVEHYDVKAYMKKASDERLKRKILPSLYINPDDDDAPLKANGPTVNEDYEREVEMKEEQPETPNDFTRVKAKNRNKLKRFAEENVHTAESAHTSYLPKKCKQDVSVALENRETAHQQLKKKKKDKPSLTENGVEGGNEGNTEMNDQIAESGKKKKRRKKKKNNNNNNNNNEVPPGPSSFNKNINQDIQSGKKKKFKQKRHDTFKKKEPVTEISDARLKAYGLNPKKYKNKLIYGKKQTF